jgi:hypothetical protein
MGVVVQNIKWIMLVTGLLTCSMFLALVSPQTSLQNVFGAGLDGPVANIIVRNWGALIGIGGLALIYGAFNPPARGVALAVNAASKAVYITLVLTTGRQFLGYQAGVAVVADAIMVVIFVAYLVSAGNSER